MASGPDNALPHVAWLSLRAFCRLAVCGIDLHVTGLEHVPTRGPVVLAARHYHYTYDGIAIYALIRRELRAVAALDWLPPGRLRGLLRTACQAAGWPSVLREPLRGMNDRETERERRLLLLQASREAVDLLRAGNALLIFPEAYPVVDPHISHCRAEGEMLPFQPGTARFAVLAARGLSASIPVVPIGLRYTRGRRWRLDVAFGEPVLIGPESDLDERLATLESSVRRLSGL
ncbi:MAG: 1-acyl-sn-glycerol-3-phosphate acyltransferase [Thermomicrobiales bacterium]|nr:1-acyl-sn-glycerol-3-phosphate acyltransferase [Thermomicrobiales bacterium]